MKSIIILGNVGSGKTSLSQCIHKEFGLPHFNIDQFRIKNCPNGWTPAGETLSWKEFDSKIINNNISIYETCGTVSFEKNLKKISSSLIIMLTVDKTIAFNRKLAQMKDPNFEKAPFCTDKFDNLESSLKACIENVDSIVNGYKKEADLIINTTDKNSNQVMKEALPSIKSFLGV